MDRLSGLLLQAFPGSLHSLVLRDLPVRPSHKFPKTKK